VTRLIKIMEFTVFTVIAVLVVVSGYLTRSDREGELPRDTSETYRKPPRRGSNMRDDQTK
jgi:hypothetical protein